MTVDRVISYELRRVDPLRARIDVVALKYPQGYDDEGLAVARAFEQKGTPLEAFQVVEDAYELIPSEGALGASHALFVGVPPIAEFLYEEIRRFSAQVLTILARERPEVRTVAMPLLGPAGLDAVESARQQLLGVKDAVAGGSYPEALEAVVILEVSPASLEAATLAIRTEQQGTKPPAGWTPRGRLEWPICPVPPPATTRAKAPRAIKATVNKVAGKPAKRPTAFVAMPFAPAMRDTWRFGIQRPVREAGYLCERMDEVVFLGDIMSRVRKGIEEADLVIGVLTGSNPNVFLEIGYAWGRERPTLFLCQKNKDGSNPELPFDLQGHRCIYYLDLSELKDELEKFLKALPAV